MVKVKICANKSIEDAKICLEAGADLIGMLADEIIEFTYCLRKRIGISQSSFETLSYSFFPSFSHF